MPKPIDHKEAYKRRIECGIARGLSRADARGHKVLSQGGTPPLQDARLEAALKQLRKHPSSLTKVASEAGVGRERFSQYIKAVAGARRKGGAWTFKDKRIRRFKIIEAGADRPVEIRAKGFDAAHIAGTHAHEAGEVLKEHRLYPAFKRRWAGKRIRDLDGVWHELSTDLNEHYHALFHGNYSFEQFYRIET